MELFYRKVNALERIEYFKQLKYQPHSQIRSFTTVFDKNVPTPLFDKFTSDQILARVKCLEALSAYTAGLAMLASSDAPQQMQDEFVQLESNVTDIAAQLKTIKQRNSTEIGQDIERYSGPIATIAGLIAKNWVKGKNDRAIVECATAAAPSVKKACEALASDSACVLADYKVQIEQSLALATAEYNYAQAGPDKNGILDDVKASAEAESLISRINPAKLIQDLQLVHDDLVACLNAPIASKAKLPQIIINRIARKHHSNKAVAGFAQVKESPDRNELIRITLTDLQQFKAECKYMLSALDELTNSETTK